MELKGFKQMVKNGEIVVQHGMDNFPVSFAFSGVEISFARITKEGSVYRYAYLPESEVVTEVVEGEYGAKTTRNRIDKTYGFINPKEENTKELEFISSKINSKELEAMLFLINNWNTVAFNQYCGDLATVFERKQAE